MWICEKRNFHSVVGKERSKKKDEGENNWLNIETKYNLVEYK